MKITTADFGEIEIAEEEIIHFPEGLYSFEQVKDYVLLKYDQTAETSPIMCLQNIKAAHPSFTVMDPFYFYPTYNPKVSISDVSGIQCKDLSKLKFLAVAVIKQNLSETVINLKSPIMVNSENMMAQQIILENNDYPLRYPIFSDQERGV